MSSKNPVRFCDNNLISLSTRLNLEKQRGAVWLSTCSYPHAAFEVRYLMAQIADSITPHRLAHVLLRRSYDWRMPRPRCAGRQAFL